MIQVAVLGYGTVGSGVVEVLEKNKSLISKRAGNELNVKYILDLREFPGDPYEQKVVHDYNIILNDPEVSVICETMGGTNPAYSFSKEALLKGKSVCTSNKELVANHGPELIRLAKENKCNYLFEASVGGGIPIIRPINNALTAEKIESIIGILNGTTNYILTKMDKEGASFDEVLKEAQEKGYAEKNPEADVEGYDACRKIAILSSLMLGKHVNYGDIYTEGITKITSEDFAYAKELGSSIKLLATSRDLDGKYVAMVAPFMIPTSHPLYCVSDVFNAVYVTGNMLGDSMYYGRGAGKLPTASAVVGDVIDCARNLGTIVPCFWAEEKVQLERTDDVKQTFFVRVDKNKNSLDDVKTLFGNVKVISLDAYSNEFGFITDVMMEKEFKQKAEKLDGMLTRIRMM